VFESSLRGGGRSGSHLHGELYHMLMRQSNLPDENPVVQAAYAAMDMSGWRSMEISLTGKRLGSWLSDPWSWRIAVSEEEADTFRSAWMFV
jgi:hypothetical protein